MTPKDSGNTASYVFTVPGYYNYYCVFHTPNVTNGTGMAGNIWVVP